MALTLKMGSRGSMLALAQAGQIAQKIQEKNGGIRVETVIIKTSGDRFAAESPKEAYALTGTKGLFVKEIEEALLSGGIDFAVHSAKDLPGDLAPGLMIAAYPKREDPCDVFIGRNGISWERFPKKASIATSSLRRQRQILEIHPEASLVPMRGNVDTRLKKLEEGFCDGLVLARAGLIRLGREMIEHTPIPVEVLVPAPGQGSLAIEISSNRADLKEIMASLDDASTRVEVEFEREILSAVGGGCSTPLGVLARREKIGVRVHVFWSDLKGTICARFDSTCADISKKEAFAQEIASKLKARVSENV